MEVITIAIATAIYFTQAGHGTPGRQTSESSGGETHCVGAQHPWDKWQKQQWTTEGCMEFYHHMPERVRSHTVWSCIVQLCICSHSLAPLTHSGSWTLCIDTFVLGGNGMLS